ncbi:metallophosphoesterase [Cryobacterium sinapicolor]|uniref:metallophosphoesterase n=1 Tax=Cryobacterium sinapicolor TaxID=1259236 RepID=UPI00141A6DFF|nr:metallophosphoesterase [Cryobacterium sinapicolor]
MYPLWHQYDTDTRLHTGGELKLPLRILHVSDIHFNDRGWDEDRDQRTELVRDLRAYVDRETTLDAILVGGDIAFGAEPAQYATAREWIDELLEAAGGLEASDVWVVPGNHDVSWDTIGASSIAQDFRKAVAECEVNDIDLTLERRLARDPQSAAVMAPLDAYNEFASSFGCGITAESPMWKDDTLEVDGIVLRLTGVNSALASHQDHHEPDKRNLVVGTHQVQLDREPGLLHLVMMHHPPSWLRDWDHIAPYLQRAHVILFGHEHAYSSVQPGGDGTTVHVNAGAVAPERQSGGEHDPFLASYNVITLSKVSAGLEVHVDPRYWSKSDTRFISHPLGAKTYFAGNEPSPRRSEEATSFPEGEAAEDSTVTASPLLEDATVASPAALSGEVRRDLRRIAVRFLQLPTTRRREIARRLHVLTDEDLSTPDPELWTLVLKRVRDQHLINQLEEELS